MIALTANVQRNAVVKSVIARWNAAVTIKDPATVVTRASVSVALN